MDVSTKVILAFHKMNFMFQGCFFTNLDYDRATSKKIGKTLLDVPNAVDCQNKCYKTEGCKHFIFVEPHLQCRLFEELGKPDYKGNRFVVSGPGCAIFERFTTCMLSRLVRFRLVRTFF